MAHYPHHASAVGCEVDGQDRVPLQGYVIGPPRTVDTVHRADVNESTACVAHRTNQRLPRGTQSVATGQPLVTRRTFSEKAPRFLEKQPTVQSSSK